MKFGEMVRVRLCMGSTKRRFFVLGKVLHEATWRLQKAVQVAQVLSESMVIPNLRLVTKDQQLGTVKNQTINSY